MQRCSWRCAKCQWDDTYLQWRQATSLLCAVLSGTRTLRHVCAHSQPFSHPDCGCYCCCCCRVTSASPMIRWCSVIPPTVSIRLRIWALYCALASPPARSLCSDPLIELGRILGCARTHTSYTRTYEAVPSIILMVTRHCIFMRYCEQWILLCCAARALD